MGTAVGVGGGTGVKVGVAVGSGGAVAVGKRVGTDVGVAVAVGAVLPAQATARRAKRVKRTPLAENVAKYCVRIGCTQLN